MHYFSGCISYFCSNCIRCFFCCFSSVGSVGDERLYKNSLDDYQRFKGEFSVVVDGLTNRFGDLVVHQDLSLNVKRGEIIGIVGGSGRVSRF